MSDAISESRFYMWRTLFAIVHADDVVSDEEVRFMAEALEDVPFSEVQRAVLTSDMHDPQDVTEMFSHVTDPKDKAEFFALAREVVHADGDFGSEEQSVMLQLQKAHMESLDVDALVGQVDLSFENEPAGEPVTTYKSDDEGRGFMGLFKGLFSRRNKQY